MFKVNLLICFLSALLTSCGGTPAYTGENSSKTEVIVHYNGVEVSRRGSKFLSRAELTELSDSKKDFIIIFSADWCSACVFSEKALKQANLKKEIHYLNIDEPWVKYLAGLLEIRGVPYLMHVDKRGVTVAKKMGPIAIVNYLVPRFN